MAYNYEYPYTDPHRYNDDWLIKYVKDALAEWAATKEDWQATREEFEELRTYVNDYFANLDLTQEVSDKLDEMFESGQIRSMVNDLFAGYNAELQTLKNRVDAIANLPSGSTTGDAELIDVRTGWDGYTYSNAGNAVRGQAHDLQDKTDVLFKVRTASPGSEELYNPDGIAILHGIYNTAGNVNNNVSYGLRTARLLCAGYTYYSFRCPGYYLRPVTWYPNTSTLSESKDYLPDRADIRVEGLYRVAVSIRKNPAVTDDLTDDEIAYICANLKVYTTNFIDNSLTVSGAAADAKTTGELINAVGLYTVDTSSYQVAFGGLSSDGKAVSNDTYIRVIPSTSFGAISIRKGSTITIDNGYSFAVAEYSDYKSNSDFKLKSFRPYSGADYAATDDCYIRVSITSNNDDILWTADSYGVKSLTDAGTAALASIHLILLGGTVKERLEQLEEETIRYYMHDLADIPLNALAYHALYDDMISRGFLTRELLANAENNASYPIYLYKIERDYAHISTNYGIIPWTGSNQLYNRRKIFINASIHGNERTPAMAIYDFVRRLESDPTYQDLVNQYDWYLIPLANPWGFSNSAINNSTGQVDNGKGYTSSTLSNYTVVANTDSIHQGIRRNKAGIDINRDFEDFNTIEGRAIRSALEEITADNGVIYFATDCHQATTGSNIQAVSAFLSLSYGADQEARDYIYGKWMESGALTERLSADAYDKDYTQSIYPWEGSDLATVRNYVAQYAEYSTCIEGGETCVYYSNSSIWSNDICRAIINTQIQYFLQNLLS